MFSYFFGGPKTGKSVVDTDKLRKAVSETATLSGIVIAKPAPNEDWDRVDHTDICTDFTCIGGVTTSDSNITTTATDTATITPADTAMPTTDITPTDTTTNTAPPTADTTTTSTDNQQSWPQLVNLFTKTVRGMNVDTLHGLLELAWTESPLITLKIMFHIRDCRGGRGEKEIFRQFIRWLDYKAPMALYTNFSNIPFYGSFKDFMEVYGECSTVTRQKIVQHFD